MDESIVPQIKELLKNKGDELSIENATIVYNMRLEDVFNFETKMFNDSEYYDEKYFDEGKFERGIRVLFGAFPIDEFTVEAKDYRKVYVYNRALKDFVRDIDGDY
jgi:predicted 3-demethylubiquinone-9 3-methyltransferase (glyoxalase superfamily)